MSLYGQYFKFVNPKTKEVKEFYRKKGITIDTKVDMENKGFTLVEKIRIIY